VTGPGGCLKSTLPASSAVTWSAALADELLALGLADVTAADDEELDLLLLLPQAVANTATNATAAMPIAFRVPAIGASLLVVLAVSLEGVERVRQ
jgi:hypothetical protein